MSDSPMVTDSQEEKMNFTTMKDRYYFLLLDKFKKEKERISNISNDITLKFEETFHSKDEKNPLIKTINEIELLLNEKESQNALLFWMLMGIIDMFTLNTDETTHQMTGASKDFLLHIEDVEQRSRDLSDTIILRLIYLRDALS